MEVLCKFLNLVSPRSLTGANLDSAFGHPLGATGARQVVTALAELRRQDKRVAVTSMCVGTVCLSTPACLLHITNLGLQGMGMAGIFVSEH